MQHKFFVWTEIQRKPLVCQISRRVSKGMCILHVELRHLSGGIPTRIQAIHRLPYDHVRVGQNVCHRGNCHSIIKKIIRFVVGIEHVPGIIEVELRYRVEVKYRESRFVAKLLPDPCQRSGTLIAAAKSKGIEYLHRIGAVKLLAIDLGSGRTIMESVTYDVMPGGDRQILIRFGRREGLANVIGSVWPANARRLRGPDSAPG